MNERVLSTHQSGVIVTDGNERSALAVTRSLGRRGVPVFVGAETSSSLAGVSRYCRESFVYPSPWANPEEFRACIIEHAKQWGARVVFPMTDLAVEILGESEQRSGASIVLPIPSLDQYHALSNKYQLMESAKRQGVPIPDTIFVPDGDVEQVLPQINRWPIVVKPGRSLIKVQGRWQKTSVLYARHADELKKLYREVGCLTEPSLLQMRVVGEGQGVFGLFDRGKPAALFAHRRLRERPPSGGVSVLRESMALRQPITDYALRVVQSTEWHGVAMVEFKVDTATGVPYLMEVNGRFWGSLQLAIDAGVDFPWLLYQLGTTGTVQHPTGMYEVGVRSRWWLGDLDHLLLRLRKSDSELSLPPGSPSKGETIASFLRVWDTKTKPEVFRLSDPRPGLYELATYGVPLMERIRTSAKARLRHVWVSVLRMSWDGAIATGAYRIALNARLPRNIDRVLVLCKGNICRSPFAAELLKKRAQGRNIHLDIQSAGLDTTPGHDAYSLAKTTSRGYGVDLDHHQTTPITMDMVLWADLILVMEAAHVVNLYGLSSAARSKTFLLGHFASQATTDIRDPYEGTPEDFSRCYAIIDDSCEGLLMQIAGHASHPVVSCSR
jgi:protein-tyrosine-phosphatase/predicted ATP-grasp superfamily ATP-dependent carboligase